MVLVSIDVTAARDVTARLRAFFDDAMDEWTGAAEASARALVSTASLKALSDPLILASQSATDLDTRIDLARLYNTGDDGRVPDGGVLQYELPGTSDGIDAVKQLLGTELGEGLLRLAPYGRTLRREDVETFEYYTALLEQHSEDDLVTNAMFEELGPQGVVRLPALLRDFGDQYQRDLGYLYDDEDLFWDDESITVKISTLQQRMLESFGTSLGTSTRSSGFDATNLAEGLVEEVQNRGGEGWGLSQVLRYGDFGEEFLVHLGEGLYDFEKGQSGPVWGNQLDGRVKEWRLGTEDDGQYYDPFVGLFEAMGRNPQASLDFFNPDGGGTEATERAKYLIEERTWVADDFNALGEALDAAATSFREVGDPKAEQAAWIASATVHFLGQRDPGRNDRRIGEAGKDSLGHLLATYIYDIDAVASNTVSGTPPGVRDPRAIAPWDDGHPIGATFSLDDLNAVLGEVLTDDGAMQQLADASAHFNAHRMASAVEEWGAGGNESFVDGSVQTSARLSGYLLGNLERGSEAAGKNIDERNQQFLDLANDVVGLVPTGGTFTSFIASQAQSAGKDFIGDKITGNEAAASGEAFDAQRQTLEDLRLAMAVALAGSPRITDITREDRTGAEYPWFDGDQFDASVLEDEDTLADFRDWLGSGGGGASITEAVPDLTVMYEDGRTRGKGGD